MMEKTITITLQLTDKEMDTLCAALNNRLDSMHQARRMFERKGFKEFAVCAEQEATRAVELWNRINKLHAEKRG